jgi:hypothetical protein
MRLVHWAIWLCLLPVGCAREGIPPAYDPSSVESLRIPGGKRCLELLGQLGVEFKPLAQRGRMATPVEIRGEIGGVRYTSGGKRSLVCDCRLALALHWSAPVLNAWNISEVEHMGAYVNRTTRRGRPSLHALGLALDAAKFKSKRGSHSVARDYVRGLGPTCVDDAPTLNQMACQLRHLGLFRELITPDHDSDHHDHFHLAIVPL